MALTSEALINDSLLPLGEIEMPPRTLHLYLFTYTEHINSYTQG